MFVSAVCLRFAHAARMVDPWESEAFYHEFEWLANNLVPLEIRICFRKLLSYHQMAELRSMDADVFRHNETLLNYLPAHSWESYDILVSHLAEQKNDAFARIADRLRAAVLPTSQ